MLRVATAAVMWMLSSAVLADRITELQPTERCVYTAKLYVAGYYYYLQGKSREEVKIHWHGDETEYEVDFVTRTLDAAFAMAEATTRSKPDSVLSEATFGDQAYLACMSGAQL